MTRQLSSLEEIFRDIEGVDDDQVEIQKIEHTITRRVQAMLKYVFGVCQTKTEKKPTAEKATERLADVVAHNVAEVGDPQTMMEEMAADDTFEPHVADALISMEETLHEQKSKTLPAANKKTLRDLLQLRTKLLRKAG